MVTTYQSLILIGLLASLNTDVMGSDNTIQETDTEETTNLFEQFPDDIRNNILQLVCDQSTTVETVQAILRMRCLSQEFKTWLRNSDFINGCFSQEIISRGIARIYLNRWEMRRLNYIRLRIASLTKQDQLSESDVSLITSFTNIYFATKEDTSCFGDKERASRAHVKKFTECLRERISNAKMNDHTNITRLFNDLVCYIGAMDSVTTDWYFKSLFKASNKLDKWIENCEEPEKIFFNDSLLDTLNNDINEDLSHNQYRTTQILMVTATLNAIRDEHE